MDNIEKHLQEALHLSKYEVRLYIAGLNFEQVTLSELAKAANIPRTAAYPPLQALLKRGIMSSVKIGKRSHYRSLEPKQLSYIFEHEKAHLDEALDVLGRRLDLPAGDFSIQYFPGTHGISVAAEMLLNESGGKLWKTFENPMYVVEKSGEHAFDNYIARRVEKNIRARIITLSNQTSPWLKKRLENTKEELTNVILVSPKEYPIETSLAVSNDMVLMLGAKSIPFAVVMRNPELARTFESIHDMVWDRYKN